MESLYRELRLAARGLLRAPVFTAAAILTLVLRIGANTAVFSVVRGVLLRPLPHADGDQLVYLRHSAQLVGIENVLFSVPGIIDYRSAGALTGIGARVPCSRWAALRRGGQRPAHAWAGGALDGRGGRDGGLGARRAGLERAAGRGAQGGMRRAAVL